jgi:hypothetical protein
VWLPNVTACENGLAKVVVLFPERRKPREDTLLRVPKVVVDLGMAEQFQALLDAGEARNRTDLGRRFRLTRARVTQLMNLLNLHPMLASYVRSLPPGTPPKWVTERSLRRIVRLPLEKQLAAAKKVVRGFASSVARVA